MIQLKREHEPSSEASSEEHTEDPDTEVPDENDIDDEGMDILRMKVTVMMMILHYILEIMMEMGNHLVRVIVMIKMPYMMVRRTM